MQDTFWTPELWCEFLNQRPLIGALETEMEQFKSSKSPKKEWEIVAFMCEGRVFRLRENYKEYAYELPAFTDGDSILGIAYGLEPKNNCAIHSVRRLSDDWTVSVKDRVKTVSGKIGTIQAIDADGHILFSDIAGLEHITTIQKLPQPILTTSDGVEITSPKEEVWVTFFDYSFAPYSASHAQINFYSEKILSTREAAEEYILNNRPLLSLNDVKEAYDTLQPDETVFGKLTALVKQKLNQ